MKKYISALAMLIFAFNVGAQALPIPPTTFQIVSNGPDEQVWQALTLVTNSTGQVSKRVRSYEAIATGLNHYQNGEWIQSSDQVSALDDGTAAATNGQHQTYYPGDIYEGNIRLAMPDGRQLQSQPLALSYDDGSNLVLIAVLTNSVGGLDGANKVIYGDAFCGLNADILYTYRRDGLEQDIILRQQPPDPASLGLNPATTRLQVLTEFIDAPTPTISTALLPVQGGGSIADQTLNFGQMQMVAGRAFLTGDEPNNIFSFVPVCKQWVQLDGRQFLVEEVPLTALANSLSTLPLFSSVDPKSYRHMASNQRHFPARHWARTIGPKHVLKTADKASSSHGLVLDYNIVLSYSTDNDFRGDTTYYVSGDLWLFGTTRIEGGAVFKLDPTNFIADLKVCGPLRCLTEPYRPAILTMKDDDSVGEIIAGSTGNPTTATNYSTGIFYNYDAEPFDLHDLQVRYLWSGVVDSVITKSMAWTNVLRNAEFYSTLQPIVASAGTFGATNRMDLRNVLIENAVAAFQEYGGEIFSAENATILNVRFLLMTEGSPSVLFLTNSLVVGVTNWNYSTGTNLVIKGDSCGIIQCPNPNNNGCCFAGVNHITFTHCLTNSSMAGVFQFAGAGGFYLATNSPYHNAGSTNIDPVLLSDLSQKTTWPPVVCTNVGITVPTAFTTPVPRDTNSSPDLGFHYDPLDYCMGQFSVNGTQMTVSNGVIIGTCSANGVRLINGGQLLSYGTPLAPNLFVNSACVQETPFRGTNSIMADATGTASAVFRFTKFAGLAKTGYNLYDDSGSAFAGLDVRNCEFWSGANDLSGANTNGSAVLVNNLFWRSSLYASNTSAQAILRLTNNLFWGTVVTLQQLSSGGWAAFNNNFDSTSVTGTLTNGYNAYLNTSGRLFPTNLNNYASSNSLAYQSGPLGDFYLPQSNPLINAGNTSANLLGLYQFTTQTNQMKETNSLVDIGYHYVSTDSNGNPLDSNLDGISDYLEDSNGDGLVDNGETNWALAILVQPVGTTVPTGFNATFSVAAVGIAPLHYQWYFNATNVLAGATTISLTVTNVQNINVGSYSVVVTNYAGSITSSLAMLQLPISVQFSNFCDASLLQTNGSAVSTVTADGCVLELTHAAEGQGGSAFLKTPVSLANNASFSTSFSFRLSNGGGANADGDGHLGADGFVFVVQTITNNVGVSGGGIGYQGITNSIGIEFDTWYNTEIGINDPQLPTGQTNANGTTGDGNHVALDLNGALTHTTYAHIQDDMNNSNVWYAWIDYDGTNKLEVRLSETNSRPTSPTITNLLNLISYLHTSNSYVGFTAATGGAYNQQDILSWQFVSPYNPIGTGVPPNITIISPTNNQLFVISPTNILLTANITDSSGTATNVSFFVGTTLLASGVVGTSNLYSVVWTNVVASTNYSLMVKAVDTLGNSATNNVNIAVNAMPIVTITYPTNLQQFLEVTNVTVTATASDSDGTITNLAFYTGTSLLGSTNQSSYSFVWTNRATGYYPVTAITTDNRGATTVSEIEMFKVLPTNSPPIVQITYPTSNSVFADGSDITITALAYGTNSGGTVTNVEFFVNGASIGSNGNEPYQMSRCCWEPGGYTVVAKATDSLGASSISAPISISIAQELPTGEAFWDPGFGFNLTNCFFADYNMAAVGSSNTLYFAADYVYYVSSSTDETNWSLLNPPFAEEVGIATVLFVDGTNVYQGGNTYDSLMGMEANIIKWTGTNWVAVGNGLSVDDTTGNGVTAIADIAGQLYVGGDFKMAGSGVDVDASVQRIARLDYANNRWVSVGSGITNGCVFAIASIGNDIYVGGSFTNAGGNINANYIAKLVGTNWVNLGAGVSLPPGACNCESEEPVSTLVACLTNLYVGGEFCKAGNDTNAHGIAIWNAAGWHTMGGGPQSTPDGERGDYIGGVALPQVFTISVHGYRVFVGGHFYNVLSGPSIVPANNIAVATWSEANQSWTWSDLDHGVTWPGFEPITGVYSSTILAGDTADKYDLYIGGSFNTLGQSQLSPPSIARWRVGYPQPASPPQVTITSPASPAIFTNPTSIFLSGLAVSGYTNIYSADFFTNGVEVGTKQVFCYNNTNVFAFTNEWENPPPGIYLVSAVAFGDEGGNPGLARTSLPLIVDIKTNSSVTALDDHYTILEGAPSAVLPVLTNDSSITAVKISKVVMVHNNLGTVSVSYDGSYLTYTPFPNVYGTDIFFYAVTNASGAVDTASVAVRILVPPKVQITSPDDAQRFAISGPSIAITASAHDYDGSVNSVTLFTNGVAYGAMANSFGDVFTANWTGNSAGFYTVTAVASDNDGLNTTSAPITLVLTNTIASPNGPIAIISNLASSSASGSGIESESLPVIQAGLFDLKGQAYDPDFGDPVSYSVLLFRPEDEDTTITDDINLLIYITSPYADVTPAPYNPQHFHIGRDNSGDLGPLNLTGIPNGVYDLVLRVRGGTDEANAIVRVRLDSQLKIGQFSFSEQDLVLPVNGIPLTVTRTYNSLNPLSSDFGCSWSFVLNDMDVQLDDQRQDVIIGTDSVPWDDGGESDNGLPKTVNIRTGGGWDVTLTLPDGRRVTFPFSPLFTASGSVYAQWSSPPSAPNYTLVPEVPGSDLIVPFPSPHWADSDLTFGNAPVQNQDFPGWILKAPDGTKYHITRGAPNDVTMQDPKNPAQFISATAYGPPTLTEIEERSGDKIQITDNGIFHYDATNILTRSALFQRDSSGRIIEIRDPNTGSNGPPTVRYVYNRDTGNLIQVLKLVNSSTGAYVTNRYDYGNPNFPHYITSIENGDGVSVARNFYDDSGRLTAVQDADGNLTQFIHNLVSNIELTIDRLGNTNTYAYDPRGNIIAQTNQLGQVTTMAYDGSNNKTNQIVYLNGQPYATSSYVYDQTLNVLLSSVDPLGHANSFTYDNFGNMTSNTDARGHTTTNSFDLATGELLSTFDALHNPATYSYSDGLMIGSRDAIGTITTNYYDSSENLVATATLDLSDVILSSNSFAYDGNGNRTNSTVWLKVGGSWTNATTAYTYDAQNRVIQTLNPDGGISSVIYNAIGKQQATIDPLGHTNSYVYDNQGRLIQTIYPDTYTETYAYDANGNRTTSVDRAGRVTTYRYDALNRLTETIYPDGATNATVYDGLGRVAQTIDARGTITGFAYDAAGQRLAVTNAFGTSVAMTNYYGYDANGNQTTFTDDLNRTTTTLYDALNRQVQVQYPDLTTTGTAYDADGRRIAATNQDSVVTSYGYDGAGRLISVTDAQNHVTHFQYDEAGNQTAQTDALKRVNSFGYDSMGRRISHTLPTNALIERLCYDLAGNLIYETNLNGSVITNHYDVMNRLTNRGSIFGYSVTFAYSPTGQRTFMTDPNGTTSYSYDSRDRLLSKTNIWTGGPTITLNYGYDANGSLTNLWSNTTNGVSLAYAYDPLSQLTTVTGTNATLCQYAYDLAGNLQAMRYANGVTNLFQYDSLNRLKSAVWNTNAGMLASFSYQLGFAGNRTQLTETVHGTSRTNLWQYDNLYRLTNEVITGIGNAGYNYDSVGNRTSRTSPITQIPNASYSYNTNDWLTSDTYDSDGNTTASGSVTYQYDALNHLTNANNGSGAIVMTYDGDGNRVSKKAGGTNTYYLIDDRNPSGYAQVLEEWTSTGTPGLSKVYNYGLNLVSQRQVGLSTNYFIWDGRGSTRMLTDANGNFVNAFAYDAYGTLIASNGAPQTVYLYCGQQLDSDLGLYYNRARYLNTGTGRFWSSDSYQGNNEDPLSLHKYLYCQNNPINKDDPSGHGEDYTLATVTVAGGLAVGLEGEEIGASASGAAGEASELSAGVRAETTEAGQARQLEVDLKFSGNKAEELKWDDIYNKASPKGFSNFTLGGDVHAEFEDALLAKYPNTTRADWIIRTGPGETGVDASYVGSASRSPGFANAELKPYTQPSIDRFFEQVQDWKLPQGQTALFFYDQGSTIWWSGFLF